MAFNLKAASDFWVRVFGDTVAPGDGSTVSLPTRLDQYNSDLGRSQTIIAEDGDLRTIDTPAEAIALDSTANSVGAATARYSLLFLLRWLIRLNQSLIARSGTNGDAASKVGSNAGQLHLIANILDGTAGSRQPTDARLICTTCTPSNVAVTTTSGTAIAANSTRVSLVIVNTGINDVTIRRSATAVVAGTGIVIKAGGGTYEITATNLYTGVITAITAAGSSTLAVEECV